MKKRLLLALTLTALQMSSHAGAAANCSLATSDNEMSACATGNKNQAEQALNKEYAAAKQRIGQAYRNDQALGKQYLDTLLNAQRGWLKYRDGQCELEAFLAEEGSSANRALINDCVARLDNDRISQLKGMPYQ
ncbi:DUF1311 domain-containing protein [Affinibrenneria salicis]|uniref:DUF1311 domain-containing protein n=1 Tax=Affinibrenneria salicis TaxID=2590031 RepID=A0A5J5G0P7_9GAMM|nr:lysozyme inhibitor LprI family protein [Affinibrenneria salicis]KAA8999933.1 DUF1311 domain-containing protein [Affinibrenneria salicis]